MSTIIRSNRKIDCLADLGKAVRAKRKADGLTQADAAALCNVGTRFFSEVERGKTTAEIGKVFKILQGLGLEFYLAQRGNADREAFNDK